MEDQLDILVDLVAALSIALAGGWLATRLRLSPIVGYVAAGIVISPFTPGFVGDLERLRLLADIGVVLLLFSLGVQFSLGDLARSGRMVSVLAAFQVAASIALAYGAAAALGWDWVEATFVGSAVALCSSAVVVKILAERGEEDTPHARIAVTWSVAQDVLAILLVALLAVVAEREADPGRLALTALKTVGFVGGVLLVGSRLVPWALEEVAAVRSRELFLLAIAALALGTAAGAAFVGISLALGAFLAGLVVSQSERSHQVLGEILPAREVFAVLFFVAIGMLIDPGEVANQVGVFLAALALIVPARMALVGGALTLVRLPARVALVSGAVVAQSAEFTFVIMDMGVSEGAVAEGMFSAVIAAAAVSVLLAPGLVTASALLPLAARGRAHYADGEGRPSGLAGHAVVIGYRSGGRYVLDLLRGRRFQVVAVDDDRRAVERLRSEGVEAVVGNGASPAILERLNLRRARVLVIADPDPLLAEMTIRYAREIAPNLDIVVEARSEGQRERLQAAGAREVVVASREAALELARHTLVRFGVSAIEAASVIQRARLSGG